MEQNYFRRCGTCKNEISFSSTYQVCTVSSCTKFAYCSVDCWDVHNSVMSHKSAWAEERKAPAKTQVGAIESGEKRRIVINLPKAANAQEQEILIVASKLKQYIKDKYDMNTSGQVMEILSYKVRRLTDQAVEKARSEGRKTVMDRDF